MPDKSGDPFIEPEHLVDAEIEASWTREAASRWNAHNKGELTAIPYEVVMARLNAASNTQG
jgi:hypothetical protein